MACMAALIVDACNTPCVHLQIHGAAEAAREAAAATICAESAVRCPSRKDLERMRPSMQLLPKYLELGKSLRAAAYLSMARSSAYGTTAACFKV